MDENQLEKLPRITWAQFKKNIADKTPFEALSPMSAAIIRVKSYEPCVALAVHAGHRVREELLSKMVIEEHDRTYEEDTATEEFIKHCPIQMIALDSRYEYDLNRMPNEAVYLKPFQSWGKRVWQTPPSKEELEVSLSKHDEFHEMADFLVEEMTKQFGKVLVLDIHSYNHQRSSQIGKQDSLPLFNLATSEHDHKKHKKVLDALTKELEAIELPKIRNTVKENAVFKKDGAVAKILEAKYPDSFVIPVEVKKVYMDELSGEVNGNITQAIGTAIGNIAGKLTQQFFSK